MLQRIINVFNMRQLVFSMLIPIVLSTCPTDYIRINNGDCFKLYTASTAFDGGEAECIRDGGHLASINSQQEDAAVHDFIGSKVSPLIGLKCIDNSVKNCLWSDGKSADYSNFTTGTPLVAFGSCVHLSTDGSWQSCNCADEQASFLCRVTFTQSGTCSGGYTEIGDACVVMKTAALSQSNAEADCVKDGGHLASVHSAEQNALYLTLANKTGVTDEFYIGMQFDGTSNDYKWTDASTSDYTNFVKPFPNTAFGDCVQMMTSTEFDTAGLWTNVVCSTKQAYACARPADDKQPSSTMAPSDNCPAESYVADVFVYSPNWPDKYAPLSHCLYHIQSKDATHKLQIVFGYVYTEQCCDFVNIYDGSSTDSHQLGSVSGNHVDGNPPQFFSSGTTLTLEFFSDSNVEGNGWVASVYNV